MNICFIGGTGRSGTTIIKHIFSKHPSVAILPFESRFLLDTDGLVDFYCTFIQAYSPFWADSKIKRLERLLQEVSSVDRIKNILSKFIVRLNKLLGRQLISPARYHRVNINQYIPTFSKHAEELISQLTHFSYHGRWFGTPSFTFQPNIYFTPEYQQVELASVISKFIRNVIYDFLELKKKSHFFDDTPFNILFSNYLLEFIPEAKFLHVYRDPRDVIVSYSNQRWGPTDKCKASIMYVSVMQRWFKVKERLPTGSFLDIKFEDLISSTEEKLKNICKFLNLPFSEKMLEIDLSHHHIGRWKNEFTDKDKREVLAIVKSIMKRLGYEY